MQIADIIREGRTSMNFSQSDLAIMLKVSQPLISDIEKGKKPVPQDLMQKIPAVLDSAKVKAEIAYEAGVEFFTVPLLKNVDDNPKNVIEVLISEMFEAGKSLQEIKALLTNLKPGINLSDELKGKIYPLEEQVADLFVALRMHFTTMDEAYGIKVNIIETRVNEKLRRKGYV
jgi:transcriptional regulator with XRE-family HTH domain